jgi:regulator of replication initiation timing
MKINGVEVTEQDYIELAKWASHLERELNKLVTESKELKSNLLAVIHQRNSLHKKLEDMKQQVTLDNLSTIQTEIVVENIELTNPEQYRVAEYIPKAKNDIN